MTKKLGSGAVGEVYKACKCSGKTCSFESCVAIKETKLFDDDTKVVKGDDIYSKEALTYQSWGEVAANELVTLLIQQNVCPNYVGMHHWFTCEDKLYIVNEVATWGDMYKWKSKPRSTKETLTACFQIVAGIYAMQKNFGLVHSDLYFNNILVTNVNKEQRMTYWEYIVGGESYYVPNFGHQFLLADFGRAYIPGKLEMRYQIENKDWYNMNMKRLGLKNDQIQLLDYVHVLNEFKNVLLQVDASNVTITDIFAKFASFKQRPTNYSVIAKYDLDTTVVLPDRLRQFAYL
jgi:serine/threonine protein kinase